VDYGRALAKVDEYLRLCDSSVQTQMNTQGFSRDPNWQDVDRQIDEGLPLLEAIAREVDPRLAERLRASDSVIAHLHKRDACRELRGAILSRQEAAEILGPQGPQLAAAQLHPWVWDHAAQLWSDGHRRAAVQAAATGLFDSHVPAKVGRQRDSKGGVDLMGQAFSIKPPEPGAPRLRFTSIPPGTPEWTSAHEGAMKLGQGAAQAIRNLATHDLSEPDEQEGLEMLAVLSYVARLVDKADVDEAT
jgi:hypothetical protein